MRKFSLRLICVLLLSLIFAVAAYANISYPALTGRVVDDAHILSDTTISQLNLMLENYERGSTNQVVVVTVPSLQGELIEDFGYQLGRNWGIGQKDKNNGVLLIVAPTDRKVRIEVGYGLEGTLTDAISSEIVQGVILPNFKAGRMEQGIVDGTQAILNVMGGKSLPSTGGQGSTIVSVNLIWAIVIFAVLCLRLLVMARPLFMTNSPWLQWLLLIMSIAPSRSSSSGFGGFNSGGGGGFSGGGGSFGGGGASGSW